MIQYCDTFLKFFILTFVIYATNGFNFSPKPNLIFKEPMIKTFRPKVQSSYFGFTINLRESSVIIGAPRAQSTLESQRDINETGAIYKCNLKGACAPYIFDWNGNLYAENNEYTYDSKIKHNQWLGASLDGGSKDTDKLVVCAPRITASVQNDDSAMHGICYWTPDTLGDSPRNVRRISPLLLQDNQLRGIIGYHMFGEQGLSVHVTENNAEILIGAPGIYQWKGSVIRYHAKNVDFHIGMSRRDLDERRRVSRQNSVTYINEVPNPQTYDQADDSYFGYSVSSGNFDSTQPNKTLYIATAPQADEQSGEAYIFDIVKTDFREYTIEKYHTFRGTQFGEYYGYAVLTEDLNGDGLTDVIITAPQFSSPGNIEQGAFYVHINKGRFVFELQEKVVSPINGRGRFGSTISKLGDINHDGYNDIAIGAPFADNGVVFIYLGSSRGLRDQPSQKLAAVQAAMSWGPYMFGHGLSKGVDIDNNGYNDFAIGAPNTESVYVYRAYPIVKILATINSLSREIKPDQTKFQIKICYKISTILNQIQSQDLAVRINVDSQVKRVTLIESGLGELLFNVTATAEEQCRLQNARVRFSTVDIFKPIDLEMHYELINGVPDSEVFCDICAAVDPSEPKVSIEKIIFNTGCKTDVCIADLSVTSSGLSPSYILGGSRTIAVTYEISNSGEPAYLPQINVTSSNKMPFAKIPSSCDQHEYVLLCNLNRGQPMTGDSRILLTIVYDASQIEGTSITLTATAFSTGKELNQEDNFITDIIALTEFTEIEAIGKPLTPPINLKDVFNTTEVVNFYEIKSNGPSRIQELEIVFEIPILYNDSGVMIRIIDVNNITVQEVYDQQHLPVEFFQNRMLLLMNSTEISSSATEEVVVQKGNKIVRHWVKSNSVYLQTNSENIHSADLQRKRRALARSTAKTKSSRIDPKKAYEHVHEEPFENVPASRKFLFNCTDPERTICTKAVLKVYNFLADMPVKITLTYHVDLEKVSEILVEPWKYFVIVNKLDIVKLGDQSGNSTHITTKIEHHVISTHQLGSTRTWLIIWSILGGLVVLGAIAYAMQKGGFFRRKSKEEMNRLIQVQRQTSQFPDCIDDDD